MLFAAFVFYNLILYVCSSLDDLDADGVGAEAVKRCIVLSFDRSDRERELTSRLISYLAAQNIVSITQIR